MNPYARKRVLVTGGLGFIGSNLAIKLVQLGAHVTVVDSLVRDCGANYRNIDPIADEAVLVEADIGDAQRMRPLLKNTQIIFNLAGEVSHTHSMDFPERDLEINARAQLSFTMECAREAPGVRIIYASTRQVYGRPKYLPVDESHPVQPVDVNGVNKYAAELYHMMLTNAGTLDAGIVRLTNVYGPRMALSVPCQGVLSHFFLRIMLDQWIEVYGDGTQLRDPIYVDDAVNAMLSMGSAPQLTSRIYNLGGPQPLELGKIAEILCAIAGVPAPAQRPFPPERATIDIGSFVADSGLIRRELAWQPITRFEHGARRTLDFFRAHQQDYVNPSAGFPQCALREPAVLKQKVTA